jgi:hypothetical protein
VWPSTLQFGMKWRSIVHSSPAQKEAGFSVWNSGIGLGRYWAFSDQINFYIKKFKKLFDVL